MQVNVAPQKGSMRRLLVRIIDSLQALFTIRGLVFVFGKLCLITAAVLPWEIGFLLNAAESDVVQKIQEDYTKTPADTKKKTGTFDSYKVILKQNLFGYQGDAGSRIKAPAPVTKLKLRLVATEPGPGVTPFAIIEDTTKNQQEVFDLNEMVFNQAKLVAVQAESVRVEHAGQIETLVLEEGSKRSSSGIEASERDGVQEYTVSETELSEQLADLPRLLSQARAVPYFKNGVSVGMRLFAIRPESLYEKIGLKNGDILKEINDASIADPAQAIRLFEELRNERSISLKLERNGVDQTLNYQIR